MNLTAAAVAIEDSTLELDGRTIWSNLDLSIPHGQLLAVIGPNGAGKTSLIRVILGLIRPRGRVTVLGRPPGHGDARIGYVPQQRALDPELPVRGRDLVRMGLDGSRWGLGGHRRLDLGRVGRALEQVGASHYADVPVGRLSGGEQQRLRIAQALVGDPDLLLCDEPLLSLDPHHQREICALIGAWRRERGGTVVFVTHDVNPVLGITDRVLAVVGGRWAEGPPDEVLTGETLTRLYGSPVDVVRFGGRVIVLSDVGDPGGGHHDHSSDPLPGPRP